MKINKIFSLFKLSLLVFIFCMLGCTVNNSTVTLKDLKVEYKTNPLGIENTNPRLSWKIIDKNNTRGQKQTAYQILVASSLANLNDDIGDFWNSEKVATNQSVNTTYKGKKLESAKQYFWKVKVWDASGSPSNWSEPAHFSMGLLQQSDWKGDWILKSDQKKNRLQLV
ncbi:MAG: hypothetical protein AB8B78_01060 [Polaribacter sp.]